MEQFERDGERHEDQKQIEPEAERKTHQANPSTASLRLSMNTVDDTQALYYPFHLCHARTLERLLARYQSVHFRDDMELQLTPLSVATASHERMGAMFSELVKSGRIVQVSSIGGPLDQKTADAVDRDLADPIWRSLFHHTLATDRRFQTSLFDLSHVLRIGNKSVPSPAALLRLIDETWKSEPYTVDCLRSLGRTSRFSLDDGYRYEYGIALLKTSASLIETVRLAGQHGLVAVTDSEPHYRLLTRTCEREHWPLRNVWLP